MSIIDTLVIVAFFEICLIFQNKQPAEYERYKQYLLTKVEIESSLTSTIAASDSENQSGKSMIGIGNLVTGSIIGFLLEVSRV